LISVKYIRDTVSDLATKGQSGRLTDAEFNNLLEAAQNTIYEYYYKRFEDTQQILDALQPFIKKTTLTVLSGMADIPIDYVHKLAMTYNWSKNTCDGVINLEIPVDYLNVNEVNYTLSDPIRKPNLNKKIVRYTTYDNKFQFYPRSITSANLVYLKKYSEAKYSSTIRPSPNGDFQEFDPLNSDDLEWNQQETQNFVDLILFYQGVIIRENELIQYARIKQKEALVN